MNADTTWHPSDEQVERAQVTALARALGVESYEALRDLSVADPERYWSGVLDFLGFVWRRPPTGYVDLSRGREFPSWFPGGTLNWVDSVLRFAEVPATAGKAAVIAEAESGGVTRLTYAELAQAVRALSAGLLAQGLDRGDRVGLLMENGAEATVALLALAHAGLVVVPLFSGFGVEAIVARLASCEARGLIASAGFDRRGRPVDLLPVVAEVVERVASIEVTVIKGAEGAERIEGSEHGAEEGSLSFRALVAGTGDGVEAATMTGDDPFMVIYTSGTTGKPKGAVHTHGGFPIKIAHDAAVHFDISQNSTFLWPADMGWIAGSLVLSSALLRGATLVCYDGAPDFPDWSRLSRIVERHGVTHLGASPTLIRGLAAHPELASLGDLSTIELLITAGEGIDPEHFSWFQRSFGAGRSPLINYTGGTEVSGALLSSVVVRPIAPAAFNTSSPGVDAFVADAEGKRLIDQPGELAVGGPFVGMTSSFWRDDERYLDSYWRSVPGVWVHGDLAVERHGGDFLMLGRSDDTIKVAGKRLGPAEIEEVLLAIPAVAEVAAIGVPDEMKGQHVVVFAVMTEDWDGDEAGLRQEIARRVDGSVGKPFRPSELHIVSDLPKTRSSKVMRRVIRDTYCRRPMGDLTALANPSALQEIERSAPGGFAGA